MKRHLSSWMLWCIFLPTWAQAPANYYETAANQQGADLKTALFHIVNAHTVRSYAQLWTDMQSTDQRADGRVWDMYSSTTDFTFVSDQCGNYKGEGDCYNREHSFPKSWFNDASPMYTDLFHLYPTDGYVNNRRSNYPFGETNRPTYTSDNGFNRLGPSSVSGYSGTVFEPADEYKGDFARTYFYMATCYEDRIANWSSDMLDGKKYPGFATWALGMLLRWAAEDPVSEKEVERNNAVYRIQGNRNPYIDFPGLEQYVWGDKTDIAFDPDNYEEGGTVVVPEVAAPAFTPPSGTVPAGTVVTLTCATEDAYIVYSVDNEGWHTEEPPVSVTIDAPTTISAYAMKGDKVSETVTAAYTISSTQPDEGMQTFRRVASTAELHAGQRYLIVCESEGVAMGAADNDIRSYAEVTASAGQIRTETNEDGLPYQFTLGGKAGAYTLYDATANVYLSLDNSNNKLHSSTTADTDNARWDITISNGEAHIYNKVYDNRSIQYNASSPRFACYMSKQQSVALYVNTSGGTGIATTVTDDKPQMVDVYTLDGRLVRKDAARTEALRGLKPGVYVVKGKKVQVR